MNDDLHMARALVLAERGRGRTTPNPMVGAVVVDEEGVVVGRGSHERAGGPHAEIYALAEAGDRARGATLYCTLEPCSHTGRTGPCAPRVADAGIRRVVVAVHDPNPLVAGRGLALLRERGIEVALGVRREDAERLNAPFFTVMRRRRPFVTMKIALSRDGRVAAAPGARTPLTASAANRLIHRERAEVDAIAVGSGTILADDPVLTPRGAFRTRPLARVVFDRSLRMPPSARLLSTLDAGPVIVITTTPRTETAHRNWAALTSAGVRLQAVEAPSAEAFAAEGLAWLVSCEINSVVLEGGPALHRSAWAAGVVDRVQVFETARELGPGGVPWMVDTFSALEPALRDVRTMALGPDVLIEGYVYRPD